MAGKKNSSDLGTIKFGTRVRHSDGVTGRIVWAHAAAVKIEWDDGEKVTWKRAELASKGVQVVDEDDATSATPEPIPQAEAAAPEDNGAASRRRSPPSEPDQRRRRSLAPRPSRTPSQAHQSPRRPRNPLPRKRGRAARSGSAAPRQRKRSRPAAAPLTPPPRSSAKSCGRWAARS